MKIIILILLILFTLLTQAASFECDNAKVCIEKLICDNPELNVIDEQLGNIYRPLRDVLPTDSIEQEKFIRSQKIWLNLRDSVCSLNIECLVNMYKERITFLETMATSLPNNPLKNMSSYAIQSKSASSLHATSKITTPHSLPLNQLLPNQWDNWEITCFPWKKNNFPQEEAYCADIANVTIFNDMTIACFTWQELRSTSNLISHCISVAMFAQRSQVKK